MDKQIEEQMEKLKNMPKIQEVKDQGGKQFKKVAISEESSDDSDDAEHLQKLKQQAKGRTKQIDQTTLKNA